MKAYESVRKKYCNKASHLKILRPVWVVQVRSIQNVEHCHPVNSGITKSDRAQDNNPEVKVTMERY